MYRLYISNANYGATVHLLFSIQHVMALYSVSLMHRHTHTQKKRQIDERSQGGHNPSLKGPGGPGTNQDVWASTRQALEVGPGLAGALTVTPTVVWATNLIEIRHSQWFC